MRPRETYVMREGRIVPKRLVEAARKEPSLHVIRDIDPYRSIATDVATGKRPIIAGRRQHREFLRRNNYLEVGNERTEPRSEQLSRADRISDILRALDQ
jgi:hypothetical protein